jgi:hypothetical protein
MIINVCMFCHEILGVTNDPKHGVSHGICDKCLAEHFPGADKMALEQKEADYAEGVFVSKVDSD